MTSVVNTEVVVRCCRLIGYGLIFFCAVLAGAQAAQPSSTGAGKTLHDLFASEWDYTMRQSPEWASNLGDRRFNDRWSDNSMEAIARADEHNKDLIAPLTKIHRPALPPAPPPNHDL